MNEKKVCKIKITGALTFEGEISLAIAHQIVGLAISGSTPTPTPPLTPPSYNTAPLLTGGTPKQFVASKRPATDVEKIACLAFYLTHNESIETFKHADLMRVATAAALDISNLPRAIDNATRQSKFLAKAGEGTKQITTLGEVVVNSLPDRTAVTAALSERPMRRRKRASKKKKN